MPRTRDDRSIQEAAREKLEEVKETAQEYYQEGVKKTRQALNEVEEMIRRHPVESVLIAAGVGLLLGRFRVRPIESLLLAAGTGLACGVFMSSDKGKKRAS